MRTVETQRLTLSEPTPEDVAGLFDICSDPRVWEHSPQHRHAETSVTEAMIARWSQDWREHGLGAWVVRQQGAARVIGYGGCGPLGGVAWNLGFRLAADVHGRGYGTELARAAVRSAAEVDPDRPVVGYVVEGNDASQRVMRKLGFEPVHRGPDLTSGAARSVALLFADRPMADDRIAVVLRRISAPFRVRRLQA